VQRTTNSITANSIYIVIEGVVILFRIHIHIYTQIFIHIYIVSDKHGFVLTLIFHFFP